MMTTRTKQNSRQTQGLLCTDSFQMPSWQFKISNSTRYSIGRQQTHHQQVVPLEFTTTWASLLQ